MLSTATFRSWSSGSQRDAGAFNGKPCSSWSIITATPVIAFDIEKMRKMASSFIGALASRSWNPQVSR